MSPALAHVNGETNSTCKSDGGKGHGLRTHLKKKGQP